MTDREEQEIVAAGRAGQYRRFGFTAMALSLLPVGWSNIRTSMAVSIRVSFRASDATQWQHCLSTRALLLLLLLAAGPCL